MMMKICLVFSVAFLYGCAVSAEVDKPQDLNTAETFWDIINAGRGINAYSGWGSGVVPAGVQTRPVYGGTFTYSSPAVGFGGYGGYGSNIVGGYGSTGGILTSGTGANNYYARVQVPVYTAAYAGIPPQPSYENYGAHGGHGFGKYGNTNY